MEDGITHRVRGTPAETRRDSNILVACREEMHASILDPSHWNIVAYLQAEAPVGSSKLREHLAVNVGLVHYGRCEPSPIIVDAVQECLKDPLSEAVDEREKKECGSDTVQRDSQILGHSSVVHVCAVREWHVPKS